MPRDTLIQVRAGTTAQWAAVNPILGVGEHGLDTDLRVEKIGDGATAWLSLPTPAGGMTAAALAADAAFSGAYGPILNVQVLAWALAQAFRLVSATRDSNDAITTASVVWPDGSTGTFTTDTASSAFPGAIDAYHVTYVNVTTGTKTVTQTAVTRNGNGAVTAQPALTVA